MNDFSGRISFKTGQNYHFTVYSNACGQRGILYGNIQISFSSICGWQELRICACYHNLNLNKLRNLVCESKFHHPKKLGTLTYF